jgi:Carboxypeptidase regulatory-like domain
MRALAAREVLRALALRARGRTATTIATTVLVSGLLLPAAARAQGSAIAGIVRDSTGSVLPGVTVEASSPALIERVRTAVADNQGVYRIVDLRPGTYAVAFTLTGFKTVRREGIELTANFTATVNAELEVGAIEETVTVSSASPVVDAQNILRQEVISRETLETLPIAKSMQSFVAIVPGLQVSPSSRDVGGTTGDRPLGTSIHGSRAADQHIFYNGMRTNNVNASSSSTGGGGGQSIFFNPAAIQEIALEVGTQSVKTETSGVTINVIPKDGGNSFSGIVVANGSNESLQNDNLSDDLRAQGLTRVSRNKGIWDLNAGLGGPIARNKVWFYGAYRRWGSEIFVPGAFFNQTPLAWSYTPDQARQAYDQNMATSVNGRLTWQADDKNKISVAVEKQNRCLCYQGIGAGNVSPEATTYTYDRSHYWQGKWTSTLTSRLLLQAGVSGNKMNWGSKPQVGVAPDVISVTELSTGFRYRNVNAHNGRGDGEGFNSSTYNILLSADYVTGSHSFAIGTNILHARPTTDVGVDTDREYRFLNGEPVQVILRATPQKLVNRLNDVGIWASDQWKIRQLTLNLGVRFTSFDAYIPEQSVAAGTFVPERTYAKVPDVVAWRDFTPRLGAAYDLTGDGRTALKFAVSRFLIGHAGDVMNAKNPQVTVVSQATRAWQDADRDFVTDCDLLNPDLNGECDAISDRLFGQTVTPTTVQDPDTLHGYGSRDYNWEVSAGIQRELMARVSVGAAYFRRWFANFLATDNRLVGPSDFDPFCVNAPIDPRLPNGGGDQICGLYDISQAKFGRVDNLVTFADQFGTRTEVYDGVDLTVNARLPRGVVVQGGLNTGRVVTDDCTVRPDSPENRFCRVTPPFLNDVKLALSYPLPWWNLQLSGTVQSSPGPEITASWAVPSALVQPSLGRPLASGRTTTVALVQPGTLYGDRFNQVDARLTKIMKLGRASVRGMMDVYNLFNASAVLAQNNTYGPLWQQPQLVLSGRFVKFGVQVDF